MYVQFVQRKHIRDTIFFAVIEGFGNVIDVDCVVPRIHNAQTNDTIESHN